MPICLRLFEQDERRARFASGLHGGQQECHEHPDDRDHDEQLDQREAAPALWICMC
jgi:hypothetical protein